MTATSDLQQILVLDIETVPQHPSFQDVPVHFRELWELKTHYQRRAGETPEEYYPKAGIWAEFGKIVCISVGVFRLVNGAVALLIKSFCGVDERIVLTDFISLLHRQPVSVCLCAHNGKEFDFPYLCRRILINGLETPSQLLLMGKKPWEIPHIDTLELWKFGDHKHYTSLNLLAAIFGIATPKEDLSGADVNQAYWQEHDLERIRNYCQRDVITTAQVLLRFKRMPLIPENLITRVA